MSEGEDNRNHSHVPDRKLMQPKRRLHMVYARS